MVVGLRVGERPNQALVVEAVVEASSWSEESKILHELLHPPPEQELRIQALVRPNLNSAALLSVFSTACSHNADVSSEVLAHSFSKSSTPGALVRLDSCEQRSYFYPHIWLSSYSIRTYWRARGESDRTSMLLNKPWLLTQFLPSVPNDSKVRRAMHPTCHPFPAKSTRHVAPPPPNPTRPAHRTAHTVPRLLSSISTCSSPVPLKLSYEAPLPPLDPTLVTEASRQVSFGAAPPHPTTPHHTTPQTTPPHPTQTYTTPHHTTPHHTTPRHTIPHHTTPRHTTPHHTTPHHAIPPPHTTPRHTTPHHHTAPYHTTPHHTTPHHTTPHHTTPHHTTPYHTTPHRATPHHTPHSTPHHTTPHHTTPRHTTPHTHHTTPHHTTPHHTTPHHTTPHHTTPHHATPRHATSPPHSIQFPIAGSMYLFGVASWLPVSNGSPTSDFECKPGLTSVGSQLVRPHAPPLQPVLSNQYHSIYHSTSPYPIPSHSTSSHSLKPVPSHHIHFHCIQSLSIPLQLTHSSSLPFRPPFPDLPSLPTGLSETSFSPA